MSETKSGGITFTGALFLLFLGLRLTDNIDWAWYWVASPLWVPLALGLTIYASAFLVAAIIWPFDQFAGWRKTRRKRAIERAVREGKL